jgi:N-methylhydantoinase A/oxoprolinase/acetone carboxylase beta subunit
MKLGIGIDTGGTYTDAVVYSFEQRRILHSAKALTTKSDLSIGIGNALDALPAEELNQAELISLSTTLGTNACVEDKGGRAKLIFIGLRKETVAELGGEYGLPGADKIFFLDGGCNLTGEVVMEPDWSRLAHDGAGWFEDAEAIGIVELLAMKNPVVEQRAKEYVEEYFRKPVFCGHELFSDLNSLQRGSSTLLNARLIPVIEEFLSSIRTALAKRNIVSPVVIVRSDGSLMCDRFAAVRPVETLLCGPAASVIGAMELSGEKDCIVIDMGGTTTDIALVKDGIPLKVDDGVKVGRWRTFVKGVNIDTFGLGGDSAIRYDFYDNLVLSQARVIPLSVAAARWPQVTEKLKELVGSGKTSTHPLHEFYCLVKDIPDKRNYSEAEMRFCAALRDGPLCLLDAARAMGTDVYNMNTHQLERENVVMRCGLTPTDMMHLKGDFDHYDQYSAGLGASYVAACMKITPGQLADRVYDKVKETIYIHIVRMLLAERFPEFKKDGPGKELEIMIVENWRKARIGSYAGFLDYRFTTPAVLVGIGAPIHVFLPDVAQALGTRCVIPEDAGVANALGAIVGNISVTSEIEIRPVFDVVADQPLEGPAKASSYIVFGRSGRLHAFGEEEAVRIAVEEAMAAAREEAMRRGATGDITVISDTKYMSAKSRLDGDMILGIKVVATAIGGMVL